MDELTKTRTNLRRRFTRIKNILDAEFQRDQPSLEYLKRDWYKAECLRQQLDVVVDDMREKLEAEDDETGLDNLDTRTATLDNDSEPLRRACAVLESNGAQPVLPQPLDSSPLRQKNGVPLVGTSRSQSGTNTAVDDQAPQATAGMDSGLLHSEDSSTERLPVHVVDSAANDLQGSDTVEPQAPDQLENVISQAAQPIRTSDDEHFKETMAPSGAAPFHFGFPDSITTPLNPSPGLPQPEQDNNTLFFRAVERAAVEAARAAVAATAVSQTRPARPSDTSIRLPKLQLPTFDGELLQWPDYWNMFEPSVHCQDIPDVTKFNYLRSTLKGAAAKAVAGIAVTGENYLDAVSTLREKFGKKEIIIAARFTQNCNTYLLHPTSMLISRGRMRLWKRF